MTPSDILDYMTELKVEGLGYETRSHAHGVLSMLFAKAAFARKLPQGTPCSKDTAPSRTDDEKTERFCPTAAQVWALYDEMPDATKPAVLLAAYCGLRIGEVCGLRVEDITFKELNGARVIGHDPKQGVVVKVTKQYGDTPTKTQSSVREAPVADELVPLLSAAIKPGQEWLIPNAKGGKAMSPSGLTQKLSGYKSGGHWHPGAVKRAGLPEELTMHTLRHFCQTAVLAAGLNLTDTDRFLGHATPGMLGLYSHKDEGFNERCRAAVSKALAEHREEQQQA